MHDVNDYPTLVGENGSSLLPKQRLSIPAIYMILHFSKVLLVRLEAALRLTFEKVSAAAVYPEG